MSKGPTMNSNVLDRCRKLLHELEEASNAESDAHREWKKARDREVAARLAVASQMTAAFDLTYGAKDRP